MKLLDVLNEYIDPNLKPIKPIKLKARPKKTLWYGHQGLWKNDLDLTRKDHQFYQEEEEQNIYVMDPSQHHCYGVWYPKKNMGVTFHYPRHSDHVMSGRNKLVRMKVDV